MNSFPDRSSFAARRSAASNLPSFHLPPPPELPSVQKFAFGLPHGSQSGTLLGANLLTPPSTVSADEGLVSNGPGTALAHSTAPPAPFTPYTPLAYPPTGPLTGSTSSYDFGARSTPASTFGPLVPASNPLLPPPAAFSSSLASMLRPGPAAAAAATEGGSLPPPPYEVNHLPGPAPLSGVTGALPAISGHPSMVGGHSTFQQLPTSSPPSTLFSAMHAPPLSVSSRMTAATTPSYYHHSIHPASAPAYQTTFPLSNVAANSPTPPPPPSTARRSPTSPSIGHRPSSHHSPSAYPPPHSQGARSLSFSLPAMSGPIASGPQDMGVQVLPFGHRSLASLGRASYHPGLAYDGGRSYAGFGPLTPARSADRPYKCDQCPQSFNRNHDLKRHKQIHLAVKPFPCRHCEKSFSRKDALKVRADPC